MRIPGVRSLRINEQKESRMCLPAFFVHERGKMGGRGSSFKKSGGKAKAFSNHRSFAEIDREINSLGEKMASLSRSAVADHGYMNAKERKQYNSMLERTRKLKNERSKLANIRAEQKKSTKGQMHTFINGFGEATKRYVTSKTYEAAQKGQQRAIMRNMGY